MATGLLAKSISNPVDSRAIGSAPSVIFSGPTLGALASKPSSLAGRTKLAFSDIGGARFNASPLASAPPAVVGADQLTSISKPSTVTNTSEGAGPTAFCFGSK